MNRMNRKGLEPLIAAVILIAITLVIAVAIIAWMTSTTSSVSGPREELRFPVVNLMITNTSTNLVLTVKNSGASKAVIQSAYIKENNCQFTVPSNTVIQAGQTLQLTFQLQTGCELIPGATYRIAIVTEAGNVYELIATATST